MDIVGECPDPDLDLRPDRFLPGMEGLDSQSGNQPEDGVAEGSSRGLAKRLKQNLRRMQRLSSGPVFYLMPAAGAGCRNDRSFRLTLDGREQYELTDLHRDVKMLLLIPERTSHSTAPRRQDTDREILRQA